MRLGFGWRRGEGSWLKELKTNFGHDTHQSVKRMNLFSYFHPYFLLPPFAEDRDKVFVFECQQDYLSESWNEGSFLSVYWIISSVPRPLVRLFVQPCGTIYFFVLIQVEKTTQPVSNQSRFKLDVLNEKRKSCVTFSKQKEDCSNTSPYKSLIKHYHNSEWPVMRTRNSALISIQGSIPMFVRHVTPRPLNNAGCNLV